MSFQPSEAQSSGSELKKLSLISYKKQIVFLNEKVPFADVPSKEKTKTLNLSEHERPPTFC